MSAQTARTRYPETRSCPVCSSPFTVTRRNYRNLTCSRGCAGQYGRGERVWSATQLAQLRAAYEQCGNDRLSMPVKELARLLGRSEQSVRGKAFQLGLTNPHRERELPYERPRKEIPPCPVCGGPKARRSHKTCSRTCGRIQAIQEFGHPRGFQGGTHGPEAREKVGAASRRYWESITPDELAARNVKQSASWTVERAKAHAELHTHSRAKGGRRADLDNQYFRSRWEANYARYLNFLIRTGTVASWEFEPRAFEFPIKRGTRFYVPDFLVRLPDGRHEWHEVKGWMDSKSQTKLKRFAKYYPEELLVLIDAPTYREMAKKLAALIPGWESEA